VLGWAMNAQICIVFIKLTLLTPHSQASGAALLARGGCMLTRFIGRDARDDRPQRRNDDSCGEAELGRGGCNRASCKDCALLRARTPSSATGGDLVWFGDLILGRRL
jgi:hypothetical protein